MIPSSAIDFNLTITEALETTKTYRISNGKIQGTADSLDALQQVIYKVLNTEKYEYPIYSFNYGIELGSLIGKDPTFVKVELKRRIQECLLQDERITGVDDFSFGSTGENMICTFSVSSIYGNIAISQEVDL